MNSVLQRFKDVHETHQSLFKTAALKYLMIVKRNEKDNSEQ
jgi:hypothetical protein